MAKEIWKAIAGYEGFYEVSNKGRVRSIEREYICRGHGKPAARRFKSKMLTPNFSRVYAQVALSKKNKAASVPVHILVLEAFVGKKPRGKIARHLDGTRVNNSSTNLCWGTYAENMADKARHGTSPVGERNPSAKLTARRVLELRAFAESGVTITKLAQFYAISRMQTKRIVDGRCWKHV